MRTAHPLIGPLVASFEARLPHQIQPRTDTTLFSLTLNRHIWILFPGCFSSLNTVERSSAVFESWMKQQGLFDQGINSMCKPRLSDGLGTDTFRDQQYVGIFLTIDTFRNHAERGGIADVRCLT